MTWLKTNKLYDLHFKTFKSKSIISVRFSSPLDKNNRKLTLERLKSLIADSFNYIDQTDMGQAIIRGISYRYGKGIPVMMSIETYSTACVTPPHPERNPCHLPIVKWSPFGLFWYYDCGANTVTRNRKKFPHSFVHGRTVSMGDYLVRERESPLIYSKGNPPHVVGAQSSAATLLHELGHLTQYYLKPQYYTDNYSSTWLDNHRRKVLVGDVAHNIPDIEAPWEVDNVNYHERPFIKQCRALGLFEGYKCHYGDGIRAEEVEDIKYIVKRGVICPIVKTSDNIWRHTNDAWEYKSESNSSRLTISSLKKRINKVTDRLGNVQRYEPSETTLKLCYDDFLKPDKRSPHSQYNENYPFVVV